MKSKYDFTTNRRYKTEYSSGILCIYDKETQRTSEFYSKSRPSGYFLKNSWLMDIEHDGKNVIEFSNSSKRIKEGEQYAKQE